MPFLEYFKDDFWTLHIDANCNLCDSIQVSTSDFELSCDQQVLVVFANRASLFQKLIKRIKLC